ncbi:MAG: hypothetical protein HFI96_17555 [Lachnospiraceae bacterium]|jgi:hypothetical protein|nr:hypothetical protein [Lachnospiraceae bacterium]
MSREDDIGCVPAIGERRKIKKMAAYRFILVLAEKLGTYPYNLYKIQLAIALMKRR